MSGLVVFIILVALIFDFINGFHEDNGDHRRPSV